MTAGAALVAAAEALTQALGNGIRPIIVGATADSRLSSIDL